MALIMQKETQSHLLKCKSYDIRLALIVVIPIVIR